jgi:hypothetical protein
MTRPAREIPTDPAHPIYKNRPYTTYRRPKRTEKKKNQKFFAAQNTAFTIVTE